MLDVMLDSTLHFHHHVDYLHSQALKLLGQIRFITCSFSCLDSPRVLYITLISWKLNHASSVWNNLISWKTYKENLEIYAVIDLFSPTPCVIMSQYWIIHIKILYFRRQNLDTLFLINVFKNKVDCCSIMDNVGLRVPTKQIRGFSTFNLNNVWRLSSSSKCVTAANSFCKSLDVFNKHNMSLEDIFVFD
jgi:hypothetical protein